MGQSKAKTRYDVEFLQGESWRFNTWSFLEIIPWSFFRQFRDGSMKLLPSSSMCQWGRFQNKSMKCLTCLAETWGPKMLTDVFRPLLGKLRPYPRKVCPLFFGLMMLQNPHSWRISSSLTHGFIYCNCLATPHPWGFHPWFHDDPYALKSNLFDIRMRDHYGHKIWLPALSQLETLGH